MTPDGCDAVGDGDARKASATVKRIIPDGNDAVRDDDACQAVTIGERCLPDGCDASVVRDDAGFTADDQRFTFRLDQAIPCAVIDGIFRRNSNPLKAAATGERTFV